MLTRRHLLELLRRFREAILRSVEATQRAVALDVVGVHLHSPFERSLRGRVVAKAHIRTAGENVDSAVLRCRGGRSLDAVASEILVLALKVENDQPLERASLSRIF